jgi:predicted phosphodiesterase
MNQRKDIRIGVIADTHGLFDPAIRRHFRGVDYILHAGDMASGCIGSGNRSRQSLPSPATSTTMRRRFSVRGRDRTGGCRIAIRHILYEGGKLTKEGRGFLDQEKPDICIFGHTHQPKFEWFGKTLLFNPGSAGPKRFKLIRGLGLLRLGGAEVKPRLISLPDKVEFHVMR